MASSVDLVYVGANGLMNGISDLHVFEGEAILPNENYKVNDNRSYLIKKANWIRIAIYDVSYLIPPINL